MNPVLLANSVVLTVAATALSMAFGLAGSFALRLADPRWRRGLQGATCLTLALPAFFTAGMWMELIGFAGAWRISPAWLPERLLPLAASTWVLALMVWPVSALLLSGAWDRVDVRWLEAEPLLRGWTLYRELLWPVVGPALWRPAAVTALLVLGNFSVPALFQARVWPAEVWMEFSTRFDAGAAMAQCWPLAFVVVLLLAFSMRRVVAWPALSTVAGAAFLRRRLGGPGCAAIFVAMAGLLVLSLALPVGLGVLQARTWKEFIPAAQAAAPAAIRSLTYAGAVATLALVMGMTLSAWRWAGLSAVLFALPGVFLGIAAMELQVLPGFHWVRSSPGLVIGVLALRYGIVGWLAAHWARQRADARLRDLARLEGLQGWGRWRHVYGPGSLGLLSGAWFVVYLLCLWDVETLILIVPPGGDTLSLMIFNLLHYGHNAQVTALCALLGCLAVLPWLVWRLVRGVGMALRNRTAALALGTALAGCSPDDVTARSRSLDSQIFERVEVIGTRGTGPGCFVKPRSVAVDGNDDLHVVDMTARVQKFSPDGRWLLQWQMTETEKGKPKGMDTALDGGILIVEPHYHRVNHFAPDGTLLGQWGVHGTNLGELWFPRAIAAGRGGDCFVSEYGRQERVQRFQVDGGAILGAFGIEGDGPGQLNRAEGLGVDAAGNVYVADSCNHRIQVFSADGRFLRAHGHAGRGPGEMSYPYDVRVDPQGRQYVCEFGNSRVQVFDAGDRPLEILGGPGSGPGEMNNPWSLCLDSHGNLYVADALNHRVLKFVRRAPPRGVASALPSPG